VSQGSPTEEFGPYLVYERLGVGGMAQVHRAVAANAAFQRPVALKRMLSHIAGNDEMVKSFVREARLASYLRHENVAQTYDLGRVGEIYFIVMELITGRNLREVLKHCGATTGPMPVQIALNVLNQICDALDYAHNLCDETGEPLGIIHRDVSPSNIIVSDGGVVKLIDFGIAKASGRGMQTLGGTLKGKFGYMAPEYIAGRIDARADLFAVGVIAHELLTNRPLFSGRDDIDTLTRVRDMHIDPPSRKNPLVPPEIDDIVMTALARDPDRRWQHATALRTALTTLTKRLDLVATNTQVVQWLDWAFAQTPRPQVRAGTDTDPDAEPLSDEPPTVSLAAMSQKITLVMNDGAPTPPTQTPLGTPAYVPAQRAALVVDPGAARRVARRDGLAPRVAPAATPPQQARPSASHAARPRSVSSIPPPPSSPPVAAALPATQNLRASPVPVAPLPPSPAFVAPDAPMAPAPTVPMFHAAPPLARRPSAQSPAAPQPYDPARSALVQQEFAQRVSASTPVAVPTRSGRVLAVVLVILAAAIAAITVYFVLPLLT
jgi:serine/threonine protein kinase